MLPRLGVIVSLTLAAAGCSLTPKYTQPTITVTSIELRSGNLLQQRFALKLDIQNPNDRALPIKALQTELSVGGEKIASGLSDRAVVVPPFGESEFDMTINANLALALALLAERANAHADSVEYSLTGVASIDLPFLRNLPFHQSGSFSLSDFHLSR